MVLQWVPSHGKVKHDWKPACGVDEFVLRAWNAKADCVANERARRRFVGSDRSHHAKEVQLAMPYEIKIILLLD